MLIASYLHRDFEAAVDHALGVERLESENAKLKKLVAERDLEIEVMREVARKKW